MTHEEIEDLATRLETWIVRGRLNRRPTLAEVSELARLATVGLTVEITDKLPSRFPIDSIYRRNIP